MGDQREVRIVALGNHDRGDDGAALLVAGRLESEASVILAGRPGPGLIDLLSPEHPCVLVDVTSSGAPPGTLHRIPLEDLNPASLPDARVSSHGLGPGEALVLAKALGRILPPGVFIGIEGEAYGVGTGLSKAVGEALPLFEEVIREAITLLR